MYFIISIGLLATLTGVSSNGDYVSIEFINRGEYWILDQWEMAPAPSL